MSNQSQFSIGTFKRNFTVVAKPNHVEITILYRDATSLDLEGIKQDDILDRSGFSLSAIERDPSILTGQLREMVLGGAIDFQDAVEIGYIIGKMPISLFKPQRLSPPKKNSKASEKLKRKLEAEAQE
ncbi:MAG: hypothetical protein F6K31_15015 [Symploca sp. SIO2G7]|nr:hypothetical protein [Symploca sp. SIO2G7]